MFSLVFSFIIDLYNLIPLIASANNIGINIMFCGSIDVNINIIPCFVPSVAIILDILNPKVNPRIATTAYTTNIPITVRPANHNKSAKSRLLFADVINNLV